MNRKRHLYLLTVNCYNGLNIYEMGNYKKELKARRLYFNAQTI